MAADLTSVNALRCVARRPRHVDAQDLILGVRLIIGEVEAQAVVEHSQFGTHLSRCCRLWLEVSQRQRLVKIGLDDAWVHLVAFSIELIARRPEVVHRCKLIRVGVVAYHCP